MKSDLPYFDYYDKRFLEIQKRIKETTLCSHATLDWDSIKPKLDSGEETVDSISEKVIKSISSAIKAFQEGRCEPYVDTVEEL